MSTIYNAHDQASCLKRKRIFGETNDFACEEIRRSKRSNLTQLPLRLSSPTSQERPWLSMASGFQGPLTPVDSSDDEAYGQAETSWVCRRTETISDSQLSNYKSPSIATESMDEEMDIGTTSIPLLKRRSPSPPRHMNLQFMSQASLQDRTPTPTTSTFRLFENKPKGRCREISRPSILSPVMSEEPYLPSPIELGNDSMCTDPETVMQIEHASSGFGALTVACRDDEMTDEVAQTTTLPTRNRPGPSNGARHAKLHMGFRADCEKCQQRVPGHYSHIIWS